MLFQKTKLPDYCYQCEKFMEHLQLSTIILAANLQRIPVKTSRSKRLVIDTCSASYNGEDILDLLYKLVATILKA